LVAQRGHGTPVRKQMAGEAMYPGFLISGSQPGLGSQADLEDRLGGVTRLALAIEARPMN
jgi:hypothetical protein